MTIENDEIENAEPEETKTETPSLNSDSESENEEESTNLEDNENDKQDKNAIATNDETKKLNATFTRNKRLKVNKCKNSDKKKKIVSSEMSSKNTNGSLTEKKGKRQRLRAKLNYDEDMCENVLINKLSLNEAGTIPPSLKVVKMKGGDPVLMAAGIPSTTFEDENDKLFDEGVDLDDKVKAKRYEDLSSNDSGSSGDDATFKKQSKSFARNKRLGDQHKINDKRRNMFGDQSQLKKSAIALATRRKKCRSSMGNDDDSSENLLINQLSQNRAGTIPPYLKVVKMNENDDPVLMTNENL